MFQAVEGRFSEKTQNRGTSTHINCLLWPVQG